MLEIYSLISQYCGIKSNISNIIKDFIWKKVQKLALLEEQNNVERKYEEQDQFHLEFLSQKTDNMSSTIKSVLDNIVLLNEILDKFALRLFIQILIATQFVIKSIT